MKLQTENKIMICAFGNSVTMGAAQLGVNDFTHVYHQQLKKLLENNFPGTVFNVINSGNGGDKTNDGLERIEHDVLLYKPDLVLIEFGINDCIAHGMWGIPEFKQNLQIIINSIRNDAESDIILITPNFMATSDNDRVNEKHRQLNSGKLFILQNNGTLLAYTQAIREIGHTNNIPVADVYAQWEVLSTTGFDTNEFLINGLNHPNDVGHLLAAHTIYEIINPDFSFDLNAILDIKKSDKSDILTMSN